MAYICNTDKKSSPKHHQAMLDEHKAAAYGAGYDQQIAKIQKKDIVFLYENGVGLVAFGYASGVVNSVPDEEEYSTPLNLFTFLNPPISAAKMKEITGHDFFFPKTVFSISDEDAQKLIDSMK